MKINPADVPLRWLGIFQSVTAATLRLAQETDAEAARLEQEVEAGAARSLHRALLSILRWSPVHRKQLSVRLMCVHVLPLCCPTDVHFCLQTRTHVLEDPNAALPASGADRSDC